MNIMDKFLFFKTNKVTIKPSNIHKPAIFNEEYYKAYKEAVKYLEKNGFNGKNIPIVCEIDQKDMKYMMVDYAHKVAISKIYNKLSDNKKKEWLQEKKIMLSGCGCSILVETNDQYYVLAKRNKKTLVNPDVIDLFGEGFSDEDIDEKTKELILDKIFKRCIKEELQLSDNIKSIDFIGCSFNLMRPSFDFVAKIKINVSSNQVIKKFQEDENIDKYENEKIVLIKKENFHHKIENLSENLKYLIKNKIII